MRCSRLKKGESVRLFHPLSTNCRPYVSCLHSYAPNVLLARRDLVQLSGCSLLCLLHSVLLAQNLTPIRHSFAKHCLAQQTTPAFIKEAVTSLTAVYYLTMHLAGSHNVKVCSSRLVIENESVTKNG